MGITCPKCGSENLSVGVDLQIYAPLKYYHNLRKADLRRAEIELWGANWSKVEFVCKDCCYAWGSSYKKLEPLSREALEAMDGKPVRKATHQN